MDTFPIFMRVKGRRCVVIGGGNVAVRKVASLLKAEAQVTVIAPELCSALVQHLQQGHISHVKTEFAADQLDGACLVIAATDDEAVNIAVAEAAKTRNIPVNVVDAPELCTFIMPSVVDRSPVVIAVSSGEIGRAHV